MFGGAHGTANAHLPPITERSSQLTTRKMAGRFSGVASGKSDDDKVVYDPTGF
jgi:hypothetical protein